MFITKPSVVASPLQKDADNPTIMSYPFSEVFLAMLFRTGVFAQ